MAAEAVELLNIGICQQLNCHGYYMILTLCWLYFMFIFQ
jgi:hypothetical protein